MQDSDSYLRNLSRVFHIGQQPKPRKVELNYRHHVLQTCALPTELFPDIQKVGIEPTSSPPQTVPSTADLLLDDSPNGIRTRVFTVKE
jgi:hypothetical protein